MKTTAEIITQARALTKQEIWEAVPEKHRNSSPIKADIAMAGPKLAVGIYKDLFWHLQGNSMQRSIDPSELLLLMLGLYIQKGGDDPEQEFCFWAEIFKIEI